MPLILKEDEGKILGKRQVKVPDKIVDKLKLNRNLFAGYPKAKGYKRINSIIDDDYNKRSNKKDKIHNGDKTVSFSDLKRIDFDLRHTSPNPYNLNYVLQAPLKQWANDELKKLRTSVKKVDAVPPVPKLEKKPLNTPNIKKDLKMGNAVVRLTESEDDHPYYDALIENGIYKVLSDFVYDKTNKQHWEPLIQPNMYKKALTEFVKFGKFMHFPTKYIYQWIGIIMNNTAKLRANTELAGHDMASPYYDVQDFIENNDGVFDEEIKKFGEVNKENIFEFLDYIGLYDWMNMPDGSDAWSDYGLPALEQVISEYKEDMTPEQTIVIINKALDCSHPRGDLSSIFIVGGSKTLSQMSESIKRHKVIIGEDKLLLLKEHHDQQVFNFDDNGEPYYKKNNYENYIDYLESIGHYGQLPPSEWTKETINNTIDNELEKIDINDNDLSEDDYNYAFYSLIEASFFYNKNSDELFNEEFAEIINEYNQFLEEYNYVHDSGNLEHFLMTKKKLYIYSEDDAYQYLTDLGQEEYDKELRETYKNHIEEYDIKWGLTLNERGLIYMEREIIIPKATSPYVRKDYTGSLDNDYYKILHDNYYGIGNCFSWSKNKGEAYCGSSFGVGNTHILLKCWVDPKDVNWEETVHRNCYGLRDEQEIYVDNDNAKIEVFDVVVGRAEFGDRTVSNAHILRKPIIVNP